jgi:WD40 repeat protein
MSGGPEKLKLVRELSRSDILLSLARHRGTSRLFLGSSDAKVYDLDAAEEKPEGKPMEGHTSYVTGVAVAGAAVVSGGYDGRLIWWDLESRTELRSFTAHGRWIRAVAASPDQRRLASVADDMVCRLWDAASGERLLELRGHDPETPQHFPSMLFTCAFSPGGAALATADKLGRIIVWDSASGKRLAALEAPEMYTWDGKQRIHSIGGVRSLAFSPDGKLLAAGGIGQIGNIDHLGGKARVELFDWRKGERLQAFSSDKFNGLVSGLAFHPRGEWLLAGGGGENGFLAFLELEGFKPLREEKAPMHIHALALDEEAETIYAAGHCKLAVWEMKG